MHKIIFYRQPNGEIPVLDYLTKLAEKARTEKDNRIKHNKIQEYIQVLSEFGTRAGWPYVDYLGDDIWELRPLRDRILFAGWVDGGFVLLHQFMKETEKTPRREIEKAKRELADFKKRSTDNEKRKK